MEKPGKESREYYDYHKCVEYIEKKYDCELRNYAGKTHKAGDDRPYQDFWLFIMDDILYGDVHNGMFMTMCPEEWKADAEHWQREILDMFKEEFGEEIEFWVDW